VGREGLRGITALNQRCLSGVGIRVPGFLAGDQGADGLCHLLRKLKAGLLRNREPREIRGITGLTDAECLAARFGAGNPEQAKGQRPMDVTPRPDILGARLVVAALSSSS
jgi:hypothetical protein